MAIDNHFRIAFSAIYPDEKRTSILAFLAEPLAWYVRFGIRFRALLTDNGPAYRSDLPHAGTQTPLHQALYAPHQCKRHAVAVRTDAMGMKVVEPVVSTIFWKWARLVVWVVGQGASIRS